jgi:tetratricopeptide (TPR) repeat protein
MLSCAEIAAELRQGSELLRAIDPQRPARQASIDTVFDHAWKMLGPAEREALGRLSVFRGGFSAEAARAVAAPLPVLGALARQVAAAPRKDNRFFLHPLLQRLAADRLGEGEARSLGGDRARPVLPSPDGADAPPDRRRRPRGAAHVRSRVRQRPGRPGSTCMPTRSRRSCSPAAPARSCTTPTIAAASPRGLKLMNEALAADATAAVPGLRPLLQSAASHMLYRLDRYAEAMTAAADGHRRHDAGRRPRCPPAMPSRCSAPAAFASASLPEARRFYRQALAQAPAEGDPHNAAAMLDNLALVEKAAGRYDESLAHVDRVAGAAPPLGDVAGEALCLNNLAALAKRPRRLSERARQRPRQPGP